MAAFILLAFILVVVVLVGGGFFVSRGARTSVPTEETARSKVGAGAYQLRYDVPNGQDPAAVSGALSAAGFETVHEEGVPRRLVILLPGGPAQRESAREVLEHDTSLSMGEHDAYAAPRGVRFLDEEG